MRVEGEWGIVELYDDDDCEYEIRFPIKFEVCWGCRGKGTHVHRGIDGNGLTHADFAEDPDFAEDYFSGVYDITCEECHGQRVLPEVDEAEVKRLGLEKDLERYHEKLESDAEYDRICAMERRYGA